MSNAPSLRPSPGHVLAVYAEPLIRGRRVALVAKGGEAMADLLVSLGARLLYVYDPDEAAPRKPSERVAIAPFRGADLGVRDGAFDVVIVPDLARVGDPEATLGHVRRLVGAQGVAVVACRNVDVGEGWLGSEPPAPAPTYGEFYDLCALQFAEVRMVGAAPFAGYAVAEFAPEREPAITFEPTLVSGAEPPEWYVAVTSQHPITGLDPYEIVQVPRAALATRAPAIAALPAAPPVDDGRLASLRADLANVEHKLHEAEARAGNEHLRAERLAHELRVAQEDSRKQRDRAARASKELEDERRARQKADADLAALSTETSPMRNRVLALEAELIEARTQLATPRVSKADWNKLVEERDRARAEAIDAAKSRDVALAELAGAQRGSEQARRAIDELKARVGEREAQLEAALSRARALEGRLAEAARSASASEAVRAEIDQLRARAQAADVALARAQAETSAVLEAHERDVAELELALRARGEELRAARIELGRRERLVRELVAQIEELQSGAGAVAQQAAQVDAAAGVREELALARRELAQLVEEVRRRDRAVAELRDARDRAARELEGERAKTSELARDAARREAALQTASWRIVELEKLGTTTTEETVDRAHLENEIDALRQALAQEHDKRERLERTVAAGGGAEAELARVLARLDEREALIAQLSAELAARGAGAA